MNKYKKEVAALLAALVLNICVPVMARNGPGNDASKPDAWCAYGPGSTRDSSSRVTNGEVCVDYNGNLVPGYSSTSQDIGSTTYPWDAINATSGAFSGAVVATGGSVTVSSSATSAQSLTLVGAYTTTQLKSLTGTVGQIALNITVSPTAICVGSGTSVANWSGAWIRFSSSTSDSTPTVCW